MHFTAVGSYIGITDFLYSLEDDSNLEFKIENFRLLPEQNENLIGTFVVRDVPINLDDITNANVIQEAPQNTIQDTTGNTMDNTIDNTTTQ